MDESIECRSRRIEGQKEKERRKMRGTEERRSREVRISKGRELEERWERKVGEV